MATMNPPPIVQSSSTTIDNSLSIYSPLLISMVGIIGTCIAIIAYHLFLVQYCISTRRRSTAAEAELPHHAASSADPPAGVDVKVLETIPILTFAAVKGGADQDECVVCLGELMDEEKVRLLPNCRHAFHVPCIDLWFAAHASCPLCRSPIAESPILDPAAATAAADDYPESGESSTAASGSSETSPRAQQSHFGLLRHCASVVFPITAERRAPPPLKRSVSMGQTTSFVVIDVEGINNSETNASSLSPSFSGGMLTWSAAGSLSSRSVSHFDRVSVKWLRSFSLLRLGKPSNRRILPY
ncbi:hypothetical protein ACP275_10G099100 [Erythranthe tilingii]